MNHKRVKEGESRWTWSSQTREGDAEGVLGGVGGEEEELAAEVVVD